MNFIPRMPPAIALAVMLICAQGMLAQHAGAAPQHGSDSVCEFCLVGSSLATPGMVSAPVHLSWLPQLIVPSGEAVVHPGTPRFLQLPPRAPPLYAA